MAIDSFDTFLTVLERTQLLSPEQIADVARELVPLYSSVQSLGEYLVEIDWLTAYQLQLVLSDQGDGLIFGPYQVLDRLGEGGISQVFKAWDTSRGRLVALKVMRSDLANQTAVVRQFQRELQAVTRLSHANIIKTYEAQFDAGVHYFAMEFVEGMDLDRYVQQVGPLPFEQAADYARQTAQGLQHSHQLGLIHRAIKPANLFLLHPPLPGTTTTPLRRGPDPVVKIIDWGLARCVREPDSADGDLPLDQREAEAERTRLVGTADYISPEQFVDPNMVDVRSDLYSLGCSLFFLLTGHPPFRGTSVQQKLLQHRELEPPSLRKERPDVPEELEALVLKMLAKSPLDRPQIPLLVATTLRRFCASGTASSSNGLRSRPSSASILPRPGQAPGTAINLPRPGTHATLTRPGTQPVLPRPSIHPTGNDHNQR